MLKKAALPLLLSGAIVCALGTPAGAHPAYKDSSPGARSTVSQPPSEVWVEFTERIEGGSITVHDPCGERVDHGSSEMNLTQDRLTVGTHGDKAGTYTVDWSVLGSDSHRTSGRFTFSSSGGQQCPQARDDDPPRRRSETETERDRTRSRQTTTQQDTTSDDDEGGSAPRARGDDNRDGRARRERSRTDPKRRAAREDAPEVAQGPSLDDTESVSVWEGIPMPEFLMALGVAAAIGAAGGRIYAGIMGPVDRRDTDERSEP